MPREGAFEKHCNRIVMATTAAATTTAAFCSRDEVYIATVPLRASKGPAQLLFSTAYSLNFSHLQHFMVILNHTSSSYEQHPQRQEVTVYDFQPEDPENVWVAAAALSRRKVPGAILVRKLSKLPQRKCWFVGYARDEAAEAAQTFNHNWDTSLLLGSHDCRHYTQGLVEHLTGNKPMLQHLTPN